jgi:dihydrofolate reductase
MARLVGKESAVSRPGIRAASRQYLEAGLIDELHVAIAPRVLGSGEHLTYGLDLAALGYECTTHVPTTAATHVVLTKRS